MEFVVLSNPQSVGPEFDVHVFLCFFFFLERGRKILIASFCFYFDLVNLKRVMFVQYSVMVCLPCLVHFLVFVTKAGSEKLLRSFYSSLGWLTWETLGQACFLLKAPPSPFFLGKAVSISVS